MDTVGDILANADLIVASVLTDAMPPWPASESSVPFEDDWSIDAEERNAIVRWASFNPSVDVPLSTPVAPTTGLRELDEVDLVLAASDSYEGEIYQPDEYRCFILDPELTEETWVKGYEFVPDQTEIVHHAIGYLAPGSMRDRAESAAAEDPSQGGWSCFGGSGLGSSDIFLGWAPGQGPTQLPSGSALRMNAGDFMVMQIHYHFEIDAPPDRSTLLIDFADDTDGQLDEVHVLEFVAPAEIPCRADETGPLCDRAAAMSEARDKYGHEGVLADQILLFCRQSPGDFSHMTNGLASSTCELPITEAGQVVSVLGHEHELGASFRMTLRPDTDEEVVLLDIPQWRFDWQLNYYPTDDIDVERGDTVRIECSWDRSLRDPDLEPAYILWADGTDDEMCFATLRVRSRS